MRQALIFSNGLASVGAAIPANDAPFFVDGVCVLGLGGPHTVCDSSVVFAGKSEPAVISLSGEYKVEHIMCGKYEFFGAGVLSANIRRISNIQMIGSYDIGEDEILQSPVDHSAITHFISNAASVQLSTAALPTSMTQLSEIVSAITSSEPPPTVSPEFDALLEKAISCQSTPDNIEEWATHIASQVSDLTD
jgi:hypothetical protein